MSLPTFSYPTSWKKIESITVYETPQRYLLVGLVRADAFRVVKIDRSDPFSINLVEEQHVYTTAQVAELVKQCRAKKTCSGVGILGFVRFVQSWYMLVIVARRQVGLIGTHKIWAVDDSTVIAIGTLSKEDHEMTRVDETRYKRLFFGIDLNSFYFSYTYNLTRTLQHNMCRPEESAEPDEKFCWNWYLSAPVRENLSSQWLLPIIQGYCGSSTYTAHFDMSIRFTLISRRSQYYAGTRYLKRGISDPGWVANDVETEQFVQELRLVSDRNFPHISSYVQVRGSVPLFWAQENTFAVPKPDITVTRGDPFHGAAIRHFQDMHARYGAPMVILNLVKHHEKRLRETILLDGFTECVSTINQTLPEELKMTYIMWDFHAHSKKEEVAGSLVPIARESIRKTGFFHTGILNGRKPQVTEQMGKDVEAEDTSVFAAWEGRDPLHCRGRAQKGILRSNCVDCLDRTNASQFCIGIAALGEVLYAMGLSASPLMEFRSKLVAVVLTLFEEMGDAIAVQYAGSLLAHRMKSYSHSAGTGGEKEPTSTSKWGTASKDLMTSIRRYYTSTFTDAEKQSSINLFLGRFRPYEMPAYEPLWSLQSDFQIHTWAHAPLYTRPLWCTLWWQEPMAHFSKQLIPFQKLAVIQNSVQRPLQLKSSEQATFTEYSMYVSELFVRAYRPQRITFFDSILSKRFLHIQRAVDYSRRSLLVSSDSRSDMSVAPKEPAPGSEYAHYLGAFATWVQGEVARHILPPRQAQNVPNEVRNKTRDDELKEKKEALVVSALSSKKYRQYTEFAKTGVWEERSGERARMAQYLTKCNASALVSESEDFVPSQAYYSAYLMNSSTFSFEVLPEAMELYREYEMTPFVPAEPLLDDEQDISLLFVRAAEKSIDDPHPLPMKW